MVVTVIIAKLLISAFITNIWWRRSFVYLISVWIEERNNLRSHLMKSNVIPFTACDLIV